MKAILEALFAIVFVASAFFLAAVGSSLLAVAR
jgi:hypothetical protein